MAQIIKMNSYKGQVVLDEMDLSEHNLNKWLRTSSKGVRNMDFLDEQPFERVASELFTKEYPSDSVKIAESIKVNSDRDRVTVVLRIARDKREDLYNKFTPNTLTYKKDEMTLSTREGSFKIAEDYLEDDEYADSIREGLQWLSQTGLSFSEDVSRNADRYLVDALSLIKDADIDPEFIVDAGGHVKIAFDGTTKKFTVSLSVDVEEYADLFNDLLAGNFPSVIDSSVGRY